MSVWIAINCDRCFTRQVIGQTRAEASQRARAKGWRDDRGEHICSKCDAVAEGSRAQT